MTPMIFPYTEDGGMSFSGEITCKLVRASAFDADVVDAARTSFDAASFDVHPEEVDAGDAGLINFLMRKRHGSPFEHGRFTFQLDVPIFVVREAHRHRAGHSYNEMSGRYVEMQPRFYIPKKARVQEGKPGDYTFRDVGTFSHQTEVLREHTARACKVAWDAYQSMLKEGIAKEQARGVLPLTTYTKYVWTCNPRSLMHFLGLRAAPDAQQEIRDVAFQAADALEEHMPATYAAFVKNGQVAP